MKKATYNERCMLHDEQNTYQKLLHVGEVVHGLLQPHAALLCHPRLMVSPSDHVLAQQRLHTNLVLSA